MQQMQQMQGKYYIKTRLCPSAHGALYSEETSIGRASSAPPPLCPSALKKNELFRLFFLVGIATF
jgi:hypothetical protein